jgi:hypothetical protein
MVLLMVLAAALAVQAGGRWKLLGERVVNDRLDHDTIPVTKYEGNFKALKLAVRGSAVHFLDVKVHFGNGSVQDVQLRSVVPAGGESRIIDLQGTDRVVNRVEFWYEADSLARGKKAVVRVFGLR